MLVLLLTAAFPEETKVFSPLLHDWLSKYDLTAENFFERGNFYQIVLDIVIISFVIYVIFRKPAKEEKPLSKNEIDQLINEWQPEPFFTPISERERNLEIVKCPTITGSNGPFVTINNEQVLNLARSDFFGHLGNPKSIEQAKKAVRTYGTGTCGPRQFYGTIDVHLDFEKKVAEFMGTEAAILYSYGFATISSVIPAFSGRSDVLVADEAVCYSIQTGMKLSRSEIVFFKHNDMEDLERVLKSVTSKPGKLNKRFIVIEGVYQNVGDIANLPKIIELKNKYKFRMFMDDSFGIGIIGKTGRGTCEHYNIPATKVEFLIGNLATTVSSVGGFCVGDRANIYHQGLNASGYVYSASLPPLLSQAAVQSFTTIDENPGLIKQLEEKSILAFDRLSKLQGVQISGQRGSPVIHLRLTKTFVDRLDAEEILQDIVDEALEQGLLLTRAKYSTEEKKTPPPSIRIYVSNAFSQEQLNTSLKIIEDATKKSLTKNAAKLQESVSKSEQSSSSSQLHQRKK